MAETKLAAWGPAATGVAWAKGCRRGAAVAVAAVVVLAVVGGAPAMAAPTPQWSITTGLTDLQTGRCLDSNAAGSVYTNPCQVPGNHYQDWVESFSAQPSGQGSFSYQNVATGRCLDSNAAGHLYTLPCQPPGNPYQDWDSSGTRFLDHATGRCLDSNQAGNTYTLPCNGGNFQNWKATTTQSTTNTGLMDLQTGRCLDSNASGNVYTNPCQVPGNHYQDWAETFWGAPSGPGGFFSFRDVATGRCLDSNAAGNLYTVPCQPPGNPYQDWDFSGTRFLDHATGRCLDSNQAGSAYTLPCNGGNFQNWTPVTGPAPAPQPPAEAPRLPRYVALGDSYSSGQGASGAATSAYLPKVPASPGLPEIPANCLRSSNAYAMLLARGLQGRYQFDESRDFVACAGAQAARIGGVPSLYDQVEHLGSDVGLITLGVGGDDAGWVGVLTQCGQEIAGKAVTLPPIDAAMLRRHATTHAESACQSIISNGLNNAENKLNYRLPRLYRAIRKAAPNATVIVVGYPQILSASAESFACYHALDLKPAAANFDSATNKLDTLIEGWAHWAGFGFVDPRAEFGNHGVCAPPGDTAWIGGMLPNQLFGPPITSFHPNQLGQAGFANAIAAAYPNIFGRGITLSG